MRRVGAGKKRENTGEVKRRSKRLLTPLVQNPESNKNMDINEKLKTNKKVLGMLEKRVTKEMVAKLTAGTETHYPLEDTANENYRPLMVTTIKNI